MCAFPYAVSLRTQHRSGQKKINFVIDPFFLSWRWDDVTLVCVYPRWREN